MSRTASSSSLPRQLARATSALAILSAACAPALAATTYGSRASFNSAIGTHYDYGFDTDGLVTILSSSQGHLAAISTVGGDATGRARNGGLEGSIGGVADAFTTVKFDFQQPVYGFGFDDLDLNGAEWAIIDVSFTAGGTARYAVTTTTPFTPVFFGITDAGGLVSVQVFSNNIEAGTDSQLRANIIDNVTIAVGVVPEPSTWALGLAGLALVGAAARRKTA